MRVELAVHPDALLDDNALKEAAAAAAEVPTDFVAQVRITRRSIDARRGRVRIQVVAEVVMAGEDPSPATRPTPRQLRSLVGPPRVAIVGAGPAGMFCALELAARGIRSAVFERGRKVRPRRRDLALLMRHGELDRESNYCFGEGGAGTFSDGKLYTRSEKRGPVREVLEAFVAYGATEQILVDARPHIGTNRLPRVVERMREHLESAGVSFVFERRVDGVVVREGRVVGVELAGGDVVTVDAVVVAPGHSARDVQRWVAGAGAKIEAKPFSIGLRVEHDQAFIDRLQFGSLAGHPALGAAAYRIVERMGDTSVFSFCMCPGGVIAPASTEPDALVVNGWSPSSRSGRFANSGFVAEVRGLDPHDAFAGVELQARIERAAYAAGGGGFVAPAQSVAGFVHARAPGSALPPTSYRLGTTPYPLEEILGPLAVPLREGLARVDAKMAGYVSEDAIAVAVESRTSSPIRIVRDPQTGQSPTLSGLFPCGEGAGFAGGIMSAALDGRRVAAWVCEGLA